MAFPRRAAGVSRLFLNDFDAHPNSRLTLAARQFSG
jgi:hypothetical protein